jgi:predicted transcriptional regulator
MKYTKLMTVRLDPDKYKQLEELSKTKETSIGSIIRYAVAKYLLGETN